MGIIETQPGTNFPEVQKKGVGTFTDYLDAFNTVKVISNIDLAASENKPDPNFRLNTFVEKDDSLQPHEIEYLQSKGITSEGQAQKELSTYREDSSLYKRMSDDSLFKSLTYGAAAMALDPTLYARNLFGIAEKAYSVTKVYSEVKNLSAAIKATEVEKASLSYTDVMKVGALEGIGQEAVLYEAQKQTGHDVLADPNNILYGAVGGAGFSALFKGIGDVFSKGDIKQIDHLDKGLNTPVDITKDIPDFHAFDSSGNKVDVPSVDISNSGITYTAKELDDKTMITRQGNFILDKVFGFLNSNSVKSTNSKDPMVNFLSSSIYAPKQNMYDMNTGELISIPASAQDIADQLTGDTHVLFAQFRNDHAAAKTEGYTGSYEQYVNNIWKQGLIDKSNIDNIVYSSVEYTNLSRSHLEAAPIVQQQAEELATDYKTAKLASIPKQVDKEYAQRLKEATTPEQKKAIQAEKNSEKAKRKRVLEDEAIAIKDKFIEEQSVEYRTQLDELYKKYSDDYHSKSTSPLSSQVAKVTEYYKGMLNYAKQLEVPELTKNLSNRMYFTRKFNYDVIEKIPMEDLVNKLEYAIKEDVYNKRHGNVTHAREMAEAYAKDLKTRGYERHMEDVSFVIPKHIPTSSNFMGRTLNMDDSKIMDLLDTNLESNISAYSYINNRQLSLRQALPKLRGVDSKDLYQTWQSEYVNKLTPGLATPSELQALDGVVRDHLGLLQRHSNPNSFIWGATHIATAFNSLAMLGNTGVVALTELSTALWATGMKKMFVKEFLPAVAASTKFMVTGKPMNNPMMHSAMVAGNLLDSIHISRHTEDFIGPMSKVEHGLQKMLNVMYTANGLRSLSAALETTIFSNLVGEIAVAAGKFSEQDLKRYARLGILDELDNIQKQMELHGTKNSYGVYTDIALHNWEPSIRLKFQIAARRAVESGVIQGNTKDLPNIVREGGPGAKLLTQFLRIPLAAHNTMVRRGFDGEKAGLVSVAVGTMGIYMGTQLLVDQARVSMGYEQKYDMSKEEDQTKLIGVAVKYATSLGMFTDAAVRINSFTGGDWIGENRHTGNFLTEQVPSFSTVDKFNKLFQNIRENGVKDSKSLKLAKQLTPLNNLYIWSDYQNSLIDKYGE